jgi:dTDP-4-dehydrorhamnose 3,5-epimerase
MTSTEHAPVVSVVMATYNRSNIIGYAIRSLLRSTFSVTHGPIQEVLYDAREDSPTRGRINEFRLGPARPGLVIIPKQVWHGVKNVGADPAYLINAVDSPYAYENPDHWRAPHDSPDIPFQFL